MSKLISNISISIWKCDLTLLTKIDSIYFQRHPVLKFAASWTDSLLTQRLITNCSEKHLSKEFSNPDSEQGLVAALETRQGHHEPPQAYYSRLRRAYYSKQKMASEKSAKTPAVLDFNTQSQGLALEGTQCQDNAKPPPREWNAPSSNKERDSHAGTRSKQRYELWDDRVDVNAHLDDTGKRHGDQSRPHKSHWERSWNQPSSFGDSRGKNSVWEFNGKSKGKRQTHPGATSPRNR